MTDSAATGGADTIELSRFGYEQALQRNTGKLASFASTGSLPGQGYWRFGGDWNSAANLAEETNDPDRVVPRAMCMAVLASGVLGFIFLIAVTLAAGDPVALAALRTPIAGVIEKTLGSAVNTLLLLMVLLAIFAGGLVIMMTGVRLIWAMSRDAPFPGWQHWKVISPGCHTPARPNEKFDLGRYDVPSSSSRSCGSCSSSRSSVTPPSRTLGCTSWGWA